MALSDDAAAKAAATLTAAIIAAQDGAGQLGGLTDDGCVNHVLGLFTEALASIREDFGMGTGTPTPPPAKSTMEIF